jgi:hypothetical protein
MRSLRATLLSLILAASTARCSGSTPPEPADPCPDGVSTIDVAAAESAPLSLRADTQWLYWVSADTEGAAPQMRIRRAPLRGGAPETVYATARELGSLELTDDEIVFVESAPAGGGTISTIPKSGGTATEVETFPAKTSLDPFGLALDATSIYWLTHDRGASLENTIWARPRDGSSGDVKLGSVSLPFDQSISSMRADDAYVYWMVTSGFVHRVAKTGGAVERVLDEADGIGGWDLTETDIVYAALADGGPLRHVAKSGGIATTLGADAMARYAVAAGVPGVAFASMHDYLALLKPDGAIELLATTGVASTGSLLWVGHDLYWANTASVAAGGAVRRRCVR